MMYLRQLGYTVYLFEGPGQGACIRLHNAPLIIEWVTRCVSIAQFPSLKSNFANSKIACGLAVVLLNVIFYGFGWLINILYKAKKGDCKSK